MKKRRKNRDYIMSRYVFISAVILIVAAAVSVRLFSTTMVYSEQWQAKASAIMKSEGEIDPERGKILADDRTVLAASINFYAPRMDLLAEGIKEDTLKKYLPALSDSLALYFPTRDKQEWYDYIWNSYENRHSIKLARCLPLGSRVTYGQILHMKSFPFLKQSRGKSGFYWEEQ